MAGTCGASWVEVSYPLTFNTTFNVIVHKVGDVGNSVGWDMEAKNIGTSTMQVRFFDSTTSFYSIIIGN